MRITIAVVVLVLLAMPMFTWADDAADTPASREAAAERYAKAVDMGDLLGQMVDTMSRNIPPETRGVFESAMKKHLRIDMIEAASKAALVKHMSTEELDALADFYSSPVGKSAMSKMAIYTAELQPLMVAEVQRAVAEAIKERQAAEQAKPKGT